MQREKDVYRVMVSQAHNVPDEIIRQRNQDAKFNIHLMQIHNHYYYKKGLAVEEFPDDFDKQVIDCANGTNTVIDSEPININVISTIDLAPLAISEDTNYPKLKYLGREINLMSIVDAVYFHWWYEISKECRCESFIAETCGVYTMRADNLRSTSFGLVFDRFPLLKDIINEQFTMCSKPTMKRIWIV